MSTIDLTPIFQAIITLLAAIITYRLIPWIKMRTSEKQQRIVRAVARTAVYAMEQMYGSGSGSDKLSAAVRYADAKLAGIGLSVDRESIEAAVKEMNEMIADVIDDDYDLIDDGK